MRFFICQLLLSSIVSFGQTTSGAIVINGPVVISGGFVNLVPNGLNLTPSMGWGSWYRYGGNETEANMETQTDALVSTGLSGLGYSYIGLDGVAESRIGGVITLDATKFPNGAASLGAYIHNKGLKFWAYGSPGNTPCVGVGSYGNESVDAQTFASWGADYLKWDWCGAQNAASFTGTHNDRERYLNQLMAQQLRSTSRPIVFGTSSLSYWDVPASTWLQWACCNAGVNFNRTTNDVYAQWASIVSNLDGQIGLESYSGPGHFNDPDYIMCGLNGVTDPSGHGAGTITDTQCQAQFSMWVILAAPLNLGFDLTSGSTNTMATVSNIDAINIDQDPLGLQGFRVSSTACGSSVCEVWARQLTGTNTCAIALLNQDTASHSITATFSAIAAVVPACGTGPYTTTSNIWSTWPTCMDDHCGASAGTLTTSYAATVPATSAVLLKVAP